MGSVVTFTLYFWLLKHVSATRLSLIAYLIPAVAVVIGLLLFNEPLTLKIVIGGLLVFAGVSSVVRSGVKLRRLASCDLKPSESIPLELASHSKEKQESIVSMGYR